jgi:hypothetical protein
MLSLVLVEILCNLTLKHGVIFFSHTISISQFMKVFNKCCGQFNSETKILSPTLIKHSTTRKHLAIRAFIIATHRRPTYRDVIKNLCEMRAVIKEHYFIWQTFFVTFRMLAQSHLHARWNNSRN